MKFARTLTAFLLAALAMVAFIRIELVAQTSTGERATNQQPRTTSAGSSGDAPENQDAKLSKESTMQAMTYDVRDLVLLPRQLVNLKEEPLPPIKLGGVTREDFQPIIKIIKNQIKSDNWDGPYSMLPYVRKFSLVVVCPKEVHGKIQTLLGNLRQLSDRTVEIEFVVTTGMEMAVPVVGQNTAIATDKEFDKHRLDLGAHKIDSGKHKVNGLECSKLRPYTIRLNGKGLNQLDLQFCLNKEASGILLMSARAIHNGTIPNSDTPSTTEIISTTRIPNRGYAKIDVSKLTDPPKKGQKAVLLVRPKIVDRRNKALQH